MVSRRMFLSFSAAGVATLVLKPLAVLTTPSSNRWLLYGFTASHNECCFDDKYSCPACTAIEALDGAIDELRSLRERIANVQRS